MAFFRNHAGKMDSGHDMNEKAEDIGEEGAYGSRDMDEALGEKEGDVKMEDQYQSNEDLSDTGRQQSGSSDGNASGVKRTAPSGTWGSNFWKDCQPMWGAKREVDDRKKGEIEGDVNSSEGERGQGDVPAEEMLSDDYYEQDGEEQSDSLSRRGLGNPSTSGSRLPPSPAPVRKGTSKSSKAVKHDACDEDEDYEESEDEGEEDDPDDADFEPDFDVPGKNLKKAKLSESEDFDEVEDDDDDFDISDEDDIDFINNRRQKLRRPVRRNSKPIKESKATVHSRRKRVRSSEDDDNSSEKESEQDSDEDFDKNPSRSFQLHRKIVGRPTVSANINSCSSELRTSGRSVRKISYVESEGSEDIDDESKKAPKEDAEEDDGDSIEKVLWHQVKGMSEDALSSNRSTQPTVMNTSSDYEPDWDDIEFYIKWKGQSYLHCQWKSFSDLQNLSGFKKVLNYVKRVTEERKHKKALSREEAEVHDVSKEMELDLLKQYSQVERIFADRISKTSGDDVIPEYLVKWQGLPYAEATWEKDTDIAFAQNAIDEYKLV